jgi:hypothetical protein
MKGDECWERCSAGVYTLIWGRLVGWWLGPEKRRLSSAPNNTTTVCGSCVLCARACVRVRASVVCCDERGQVGRCGRCWCDYMRRSMYDKWQA